MSLGKSGHMNTENPSRVADTPPVGAVSVPASKPSGNQHLGDARASAFNPAMTNATTTTTTSDKNRHDESQASSMGNTTTNMMSAVKEAVPISTEELKAKLAEAQATISRLTSAAAQNISSGVSGGISSVTGQQQPHGEDDGGLRQRPTHKSTMKDDAVMNDMRDRLSQGVTGPGTSTGTGTGVPVPIVAGLCLLSFLLAYFLF